MGTTLTDDVAIVTGAGRNIGRAIAELFAAEGAKVVVADVDADRATETVERIEADGGAATVAVVDVTDEAQVRAMVETAESTFGPVDVLVNNVAISDRDPFLELSLEAFERVLAVNLRGTFLCTQAAARSMQASGGGRIVNVASTSAHRGRPTATAYATTKAGICNFTRSVAKALAEHDIRVNTLSPTRSGSRVGQDDAREGEVPPDILAGRWGVPEDQARAALFLVDPANGFVTGTELLVDGGASA